MRRVITIAIYILGAAGAGFAQVGAPQMGWIPDGTSIRSVYGIPAAAAIGPVVPLDQDFAHIVASPARNYVLASSAHGGAVLLYTPDNGLVPLVGAGSAPDLLVLSPRGSAAALWFASTNRVQVITGLPDAPQIQLRDASSLRSAPEALAVSDDGAWITGAWSGGVSALGANGEVYRLPVRNVGALAFFQGTHDLAVANATGLQVVTGVGGATKVSNFLASSDGSLRPAGLATTSDNQTLVLADRGGTVTTVDLASGAATTVDCGCKPEGLFGMGPSTFRLTGLDAGAFKLFDVNLGEVLFAPLALAEASGAGQ